ncbi:MAG: SLBB domain-containing protein [Armatimonadetes bacterium]|nr:SLBB domain-containing protein [Armatimonadota bacterium]
MKTRLLLTILLIAASLAALGQTRKVQALDKLKVTCTEESLISKDYKVTKDGLILVDFLGAVDVAGLTEAEVADKLSKKLVEDRILKKATMSVAIVGDAPAKPDTNPGTSPETKPVTDPGAKTETPENPPAQPTAHPVKVSGAVKTPGDVTFQTGLKLSEVVKKAVPLEDVDLTKVAVKSADGSIQSIDLTQPSADLLLKPGDEVLLVLVPGEVTVMGGVVRPGAVKMAEGMTAKKAIEAVGGFTALAVKKKVGVERPGQAIQYLDFTQPNADMLLTAKDKIVVGVVETRAYIQVDGAVRNPGYVVLGPETKLSDAIQAAGGLDPRARADRIMITSADTPKPRVVNFKEIEQGYAGDIALKIGDKVSVPGAKRDKNVGTKVAIGVAAFWFLFGR